MKIEFYTGLAIGIFYADSNNKKHNTKSDESIAIIIPFIVIIFEWSKKYKLKIK